MIERDPEILKIPAFMRRGTFRRKRQASTVATALERKQQVVRVKRRSTTQKKRSAFKRPVQKVAPVKAVTKPVDQRVAKRIQKVTKKKVRVKSVRHAHHKKLLQRKKSVKNKKVKRPAIKKQPQLKRPVVIKEQVIGEVTHYYDKIKVAVLKLKQPLSTGDTIRIVGGNRNFTQVASSMQINHQTIIRAKKGDDVGMKLKKEAHPGDRVSLVNEE